MVEVATLELTARTDGLLKAEQALGRVTAAAAKTDAAAGKVAIQTEATSGSFGRLGAAAASNSYKLRGVSQQLSQVGQQTMATGNFVQALAIQLPDIGLAFGAVGTAVGLLAGVALPTLLSAFQGSSSSAAELENRLDRLSASVSAYKAAVDLANQSTDEMRIAYGDAAGAIDGTLQLLQQIAASDAQSAIDEMSQSLAELLGTGGAGDQRSELASFFDVDIVFAFTDAQRASREEARLLTSQFQDQQRPKPPRH